MNVTATSLWEAELLVAVTKLTIDKRSGTLVSSIISTQGRYFGYLRLWTSNQNSSLEDDPTTKVNITSIAMDHVNFMLVHRLLEKIHVQTVYQITLPLILPQLLELFIPGQSSIAGKSVNFPELVPRRANPPFFISTSS